MTLSYPQWVDALRHRLPGESAGQQVCRVVRALDGISLVHDADRLAELFLCNESEARSKLVASWRTNCATTARQVYCLCGCVSEHVIEPYVNGRAFDDVRSAAKDAGAVLPGSQWRKLGPGWGMLYWTTGNDAHFEFCLGPVDAVGVADHGGGGRSDNAIACGHGSILSNWGRPLQVIFDPELLCTLPATGDDPY